MLEVVAECTFAGLAGTIDNLAGRVDPSGHGASKSVRRDIPHCARR
jgi:hypothetical protein